MMPIKCLFPLLMLAASAAAAVPGKEVSSVTPTTGLLQIFLGLIAVLALMAAAAWFFKKMGPASKGNIVPVKIVGGVSLGNRERVMVVEVADQWIVLGVTASQINTLSTMPRQEKLAAEFHAPIPENQFSVWLKRHIDKRTEVS
ncbi:flagellar biosynthetic protein FliO [Undibacterium sp. Ren11W]|uniref:flagellar biosynthetic protein FliO n=1 Tax=Undibacterium sp. Ren11W TaxID=3413045 RepID=UPI003BF41FA9